MSDDWNKLWNEIKNKFADDPQGQRRHGFKGKEAGTVAKAARDRQHVGKNKRNAHQAYQKWNANVIETGKKK